MAGLVPCKFFSRGTCRYGDSCKFFHNRNENSGFNYANNNNYQNQILSPGNFRPQGGQIQSQQQQYNQRQQGFNNKSAETISQIEDATIKDMKEWTISKMWPLSCYAPVSSKACLPGFEDYSPEELRLSWLEHGKQPPPDLNLRLQRVNELRMLYQQSNPSCRAMIDRLIKGATTEQIAAEFNLASAPWGTPAVANPTQTAGMFNPGIMTQPQPGFLNNPVASGAGGMWGQPQGFPLGSQQMTSGIFPTNPVGGDTMDASELNTFMTQNALNALQPSGISTSFLNPPSALGQAGQPQQSIFSLDGNNPNANAFPGIGSGTPFTPIFTQGMQQQQMQPQQKSIFGGYTTTENAPNTISFTQTPQPQQQQPTSGKFVYSEEADLTDEEKANFLAPLFEVVPLKPPPRSSCF